MWPDLGLNLFAEAVGVAFTVLVIQVLLEQRERAQKLPILAAAARDGALLAGRTDGLLANVLVSITYPSETDLLDQLDGNFADERLVPIYARPLQGVACVLAGISVSASYIPWDQYLATELADLKRRADKLLERFGSMADPELIHAVHDFQNLPTFAVPPSLFTTHSFPDAWLGLARAAAELRSAINQMGVLDAGAVAPTGESMRAAVDRIRRAPVWSPITPYRPRPTST